MNLGDEAERLIARYPRSTVAWPQGVLDRLEAGPLRDLYHGCLLWGAVGDALGRPAEGTWPASLLAEFGPTGLARYQKWHGWSGGPIGTITDDTQLTMEVARSVLATGGRLDPMDLSRRLVAWLPHGRGKGRGTTEAVEALMSGEPWWRAGVAANSAGNGAAMRAAPLGLVAALDATPAELIYDAVLSALPTHNHRVGVAGAVVVAAGVGWCVRERLAGAGRLDVAAFLTFVRATIAVMEDRPTDERKPDGTAIRLFERIGELEEIVSHLDPREAFARLWNGAFALESVPAALYCFLRRPDSPREVVLTAVYGGHDADTVASMAGNLAGAWCGAALLRSEGEWWAGLEYRDELVTLADGLLKMALARG